MCENLNSFGCDRNLVINRSLSLFRPRYSFLLGFGMHSVVVRLHFSQIRCLTYYQIVW